MRITLAEIEKRIKSDLERIGFEKVFILNGMIDVDTISEEDSDYYDIDRSYAYLENLKKLYKFFYENPNALEGFRSDVKSQELLQILYRIYKEDFKLSEVAPPSIYKTLFKALGIREIHFLQPEQLHLLKKERSPEVGGSGAFGIVSVNKPKNVATKYTTDSNEIQVAAFLAFKFHSTGKLENRIQNIYDICQKDVPREELKTTITKYETDILKPVDLTVTLKKDIPVKEIPKKIQKVFGWEEPALIFHDDLEFIKDIFEEESAKELIKLADDLLKSYNRLRELKIYITDFSIRAVPIMEDIYKAKIVVNNIMENPQGNYIIIDYGSCGAQAPKHFKIPKCFTEETILSVNSKYDYVRRLKDLSEQISRVPNEGKNER